MRLLQVVLALGFLLGAPSAHAAPPKTISYQGYLTSSTGVPVNGSLSIVFSLYVAASGGSPLWTETQNVTVANGNYSVVLGANGGNPINLTFDNPYYLGVRVGADAEMAPRAALTMVPYAFRATVADAAAAATTALTANTAIALQGIGQNTGTATNPLSGGSDCTIGEVRLFARQAGNVKYLPASGQLLLIATYQVLFSLLGTTYGGDGRTTFQLPDLRPLTPNNMTYEICVNGVF